MYAHVFNHTVAGYKMKLVVIDERPSINIHPNAEGGSKIFKGFLCNDMEGVFKLAAKNNAEVMEGGKQLLEGDF